MKGVSTVVATVLVLMITVALAASAYLWFTSIFQNVSTGAGESVAQVGEITGTSFSVTSAAGNTAPATVYLLNTGTVDIAVSSVAVFVSGIKTVSAPVTGVIAVGGQQTITVSNATGYTGAFCGQSLKVTVQGGLAQTATFTC